MGIMFEQYVEIVFNKKIISGTFLLGFRSEEIVTTAKPGQFVMIRVRSGVAPLLRRPFSISGTEGDDLFFILYRVVGPGTAIMAETKKGERLSVLGPLGKGFEIPKNNQIPLLVAGGIGVAPLIFLAQTVKSRPVQFMMGFGSASEIIAIDWMGRLPVDVSIATDDGTSGHAGPVTDLLEAYLRQNRGLKDSLSVFTCGPGPMLKKLAALTIDHDIPCQVSMEAAMACGLGACQGCAVKASSDEKRAYFHVCKEGPVFPVQAIDWKNL